MPGRPSGREKNEPHTEESILPGKDVLLKPMTADPSPLFCEQDFRNYYVTT